MAQGLKNAPKVTLLLPFWVFCTSPSETLKNLTECAGIGVKQLNSANKNPNVCK